MALQQSDQVCCGLLPAGIVYVEEIDKQLRTQRTQAWLHQFSCQHQSTSCFLRRRCERPSSNVLRAMTSKRLASLFSILRSTLPRRCIYSRAPEVPPNT